MRILVVTLLYPIPDNPVRGVFVEDRVKLLRKLGHDVRVINPLPRMLRMNELRRSTLRGVAKTPKVSTDGEHNIFHPRYIQIPNNNLLKCTIFSVRRLARKVEKWLGDWRPEAISCHTLWPVAELAETLSNRWNIPWIATVHGFDFDVGLKTEIEKHIRRLAGSATRLVTVSSRLADIAKETGTRSDCEFIPCHTAVPKESTQSMRAYQGHWRRGKLEVLFPANPRRLEKRHLLALKACAELETRGWNVHMGGLTNVPRNLVFDRMLTCDLALITSSREAGPLVARESIACGLPVVGVDVGDLKSWLPDRCIAATDTSESIADAIEATIGTEVSDFVIPDYFTEESVSSAVSNLIIQIQKG